MMHHHEIAFIFHNLGHFWPKLWDFMDNLLDFARFHDKFAHLGQIYPQNIEFLVYFLCKSIFLENP